MKSWTVTDELWEKIEPFIPPKSARPKNVAFKRKPGGGRKPIENRKIFEAIVYVLRTGIQWKALPTKLFGSASAIHAHFLRWVEADFFERIWSAGLAEYDGMHGIAWEWQSVDGAMNKAPLATPRKQKKKGDPEDVSEGDAASEQPQDTACVGRNPTDRGKKWTQTQLACRRSWRPAVSRRRRSTTS